MPKKFCEGASFDEQNFVKQPQFLSGSTPVSEILKTKRKSNINNNKTLKGAYSKKQIEFSNKIKILSEYLL